MQHRIWRVYIIILFVVNLFSVGGAGINPAQAAQLIAPSRSLSVSPEAVETIVNSGLYSSIALAPDGLPHIAYYDSSNGNLRYASKVGLTWQPQTLDVDGDVGSTPTLAIDEDGLAHIAYYDETNDDLLYARQESPDPGDPDAPLWVFTRVDENNSVGKNASLDLDTLQRPHIAYWDATNHALKYTYFDGSAWVKTSIPGTTDLLSDSSIFLALTSANLPRIAYRQSVGQSPTGLGYASFNGTTWSVETAYLSSSVGERFALALDSSNNPHVSFMLNGGGLRYVQKTTAWSTPEIVVNNALVGSLNSLALDSEGRPRIVYFDGNTVPYSMGYAYKDGSTWRLEKLVDNGSSPDLVFAPDGSAHISFLNQSTNKQFYLTIPPFPDLRVADLWLTGSTVNFQMINTGLGDAFTGVKVALIMGGSKVETKTLTTGIPAGSRSDQSFSYAYSCTIGATINVRADADPGALIAETTRSNNSRSESWLCKGTKPVITAGPTVTGITHNSATINWTTSTATDSLVKYSRRVGFLTNNASSPAMVTTHRINLTSLAAGANYAFEVTSTDITGQSVTSKTVFLETLPPGGTVSPLITRSITKDDGPGEVYTLKASVPGATGLEKVEFFYQLTPASPLMLIGTAFSGTPASGGTVEFAAKFSPGKANLSRLGLSSANFITQVSIPGGSPQNFEDLFSPLNPLPPQVSIITPNPDYTFYITSGTTLPAGTQLPVSAHASGFEWECDWSGADPLPNCADVEKPVDRMYFKIGTKEMYLSTPGYDYSHTFSLAGMGAGNYILLAQAYFSDQMSLKEIPIHIKSGTPEPVLERAVVRNGNSFRVTLTIKNDASATGPLVVDGLYDYVRGFQPVFDESGDERIITGYTPSTRINQLMIDLDDGASETRSISAGGSYAFTYDLVPVIYETDVQYAIGEVNVTSLVYKVEGVDKFQYFNLPVNTLADPTQITLAASVAKALKLDDYLLVTHPANLKAQFSAQTAEPTWNTVLRRMAELAQIRQGVLAYLDSQDFNTLDDLLDPGSHTWADKLHPNYKNFTQGYVLIVGEPEIVPSYTKTGLLGGTVRMTDNPYANTGGNGAPELVLGRIPGTSPGQLIAPINTSLKVLRAELTNDRSDALISSGTGDGIGDFQDSAETAKSQMMDDGFAVTLLHEEELARTLSITIPFDDGDLLAAGNLDGDGDQELVIGDVSTDDIYVVSISEGGYSRDFWFHYPYDIKAGHGFAVGDVDGDLTDELVIADDNDHIYMFKFPSGMLQIDQPLDNWDKLALGNVDGDPQKEIIITHNGFVVKRNLDGTPVGSSFLLAVNSADDLAAGRIWDSDAFAEIILMSASQNMGYIFSFDGTLRASFPAVYSEGDFVIAADVDKDPADPKPDEIWVLNSAGNAIQGYYAYGDEPSSIYIPQRVMEADKISALQISGDAGPSIWLVRRTDDTYRLDSDYPDYMQTRYRNSAKNKDVLNYRGHGSSNSWESVNVLMNPDLDFQNSAPMAIGITCSSGDYSDPNNYSQSERMLWWGAGAFFGATETSGHSFNNKASGWISDHLKDTGPFARLFVRYKQAKYDDGTNYSNMDWPYWVYEYNFYGDAKFGFIGNTTALPAPDTAAHTAESDTLHVTVPAYEVTQTDGYDYVDIPGGETTQNDGELRIPYYVVIEDYPKGTRVNAVSLTARTGKTTATGLNLPLYSLMLDGNQQPTTTAKPVAPNTPTDEIDWTPSQDQVFSWQVNERGDGSSQLVIRLNPFYYSPATTNVEYYTSYDFNIETTSTKQEITHLGTDAPVYRLNQKVVVDALIQNNSSAAADVLASATLYSISGARTAGADLRALKEIAGDSTAGYGVTINTTGLPAGSYYIEMELRDTAGNVIDTETVDLELGMVSAQITALTAVPKLFHSGDAVNINLAVTNNGDLLLSGAVAQVIVSDPAGLVVASYNQPLADLAASASTQVPLVWTATGATQWRYTVEGRILYNSQSTPISSIFVNTQVRFYLPTISR